MLKQKQDTCKWCKLLTSTLADDVCKIIFDSTSSCQYLIQHQTFTAIYVIVKLTNTILSISDEFEYKNLYLIEMMILISQTRLEHNNSLTFKTIKTL